MPSIIVFAAACGSDPGAGDDVVDNPACGNGVLDSGEQCDDGNDDRFDGCRADCTIVDPLQPPAMTWQFVEVPGTKCIDGLPAGFSINHNPASTKLFIYMEGGGACFNQFCESLFTRSSNQPSNGGVFDRTNQANPVRDWSWVYIPYCTGDVYGGQAETMLAGKLRHFYGYSNHTAFLERLVPSFTIDQVVLSGASAGGFGAVVNFAQTQRAYGDVPVVLIDDSGPPLSADVFPPCLQTLWRTTWGLDKTIIAECGAACSDPSRFVGEAFDQIGRTFPAMRGGVFSSVGDNTIRTFAGYGWSGGYNMCGSIPTAATAPVYQAGLDALRTKVMQNLPGLGTYYIPGSSHTVLRTANYYATTVAGTSVAQWIQNAVTGTTAHLGP
jgi:cysteine-rich repeat protein